MKEAIYDEKINPLMMPDPLSAGTPTHDIDFIPSGRGKAQCAPNPEYPEGIDVDCSAGLQSCDVKLPYPAPECGFFNVSCRLCGMIVGVTAAGRPDDPRTLKMPCLAVRSKGNA